MSQIITHSITCPFCGYMGNIAVTEKANIDSTTDIKEKLLKKLFFKFKCPDCYKDFQAEYSVLFENLENNLLIYYVPEKETATMKKVEKISVVNAMGNKLRIVNNQNELLEKILVTQDRLDDIIIEYVKHVIVNSVAKEQKDKVKNLYYSGTKDDTLHFVAPLKDGLYNVNIPKSMYTNYNTKYNIKEAHRFVKIDKDNVERFMF